MNSEIEYFLAVCACGSISKAGKSLHVTPQAVSKAIGQLEDKLGFPVLIRTIDGCVPTEKGLEVQRIGLRMRRFQKQAELQIYGLAQSQIERQTVHIGLPNLFATMMPPSDFADFHSLYPGIGLVLHGYNSVGDCEKALCAGEIELAFCGNEYEGCGFICLQKHDVTPYLIVNGKNRLAGRGRIQFKDIAGETLIADSINGEDYLYREEIEKAGLSPALILPYMNDALKRNLVLEHNYVAFSACPTGWLPYGIVPVLVSDIPLRNMSTFACASNRPLSEAAQRYVDFIVPRFKKDIFGNR